MKKFLLALIVFVLLGAVGVAATLGWANDWLDTPMPLTQTQMLEVPAGRAFSVLGEDLHERGWLAHPRVLALYARAVDLAGRIKAGEYQLDPGLTPRELLSKLVDGDVFLHQVALIEGWTFAQALAAIQAHEAIAVTLEERDGAQVMQAMGLPGEHPEGRLYPDTYKFARGTTDAALLRRANLTLMQRLQHHWDTRAEGLPFDTPYEALILASIVERETGEASERPTIAGVFVRRMQIGMRLQSDPTVIYGLGEAYDGDIRTRDLRTDTPFNTYTRGGLPPTPIALAGDGALAAVMQPAAGTSLYFVASPEGDGSHYFSDSLAEHEAAVKRYLRGPRKPKSSATP